MAQNGIGNDPIAENKLKFTLLKLQVSNVYRKDFREVYRIIYEKLQ